MRKGKADGEMRIGALAAAAGVHVETVRYYQRRGLLRTPGRPAGGIRRYNDDDLARLRFIRRAKALGFSLRDIRALLQLDEQSCAEVREIAGKNLSEIRSRIRDLESVATALERMVRQCESTNESACPIIDSLTHSQS